MPFWSHLGSLRGPQNIDFLLVVVGFWAYRRFALRSLKIAQDGPKMAQDSAKTATRWPQDRPKMAQDGPNMAQDAPKFAPRRPKKAPGWIQVTSYRDLLFIFSSASCRYLPKALRRPSRTPPDPPRPTPRTPKYPPGGPPAAPRRLRGSCSNPLIHSESRSTLIGHSGYI